MKKLSLSGALCAAALIFTSMPSNSALIGRLPLTPDGTDFQAAYDTVLNITWLTDAALSGNNTWPNQLAWVDSLNSANHLGFNHWRLASMSVAAGLPTGIAATSVVNCFNATELACRDNELGYMYYHNLGAGDLRGTQTIGNVTLTDIQALYWSGTEGNPWGNPRTAAWYFVYSSGFSSSVIKSNNTLYGWAVGDGDVLAAPIPTAIWLFSSGLLGLVGMARRKRTA